jgi:hypothetical protein
MPPVVHNRCSNTVNFLATVTIARSEAFLPPSALANPAEGPSPDPSVPECSGSAAPAAFASKELSHPWEPRISPRRQHAVATSADTRSSTGTITSGARSFHVKSQLDSTKLLLVREFYAEDPVLVSRSYGRPLWVQCPLDANDLSIWIIQSRHVGERDVIGNLLL